LSTKSGSQPKAEQLQWRRFKVVEMRAKGMSQIEIARQLQVSDSSISSDVQYLREQAKESQRVCYRSFTRAVPGMSYNLGNYT
jgi:transcriptional regulator